MNDDPGKSVFRLWAPWRQEYITGQTRGEGCVFCSGSNAGPGSGGGNYVIFRTDHSLCMMNLYPYNPGHLLISPFKHVNDITLLEDEEYRDLFEAVRSAKRLLSERLSPQGFNIGINMGSVAGAGIVDHIHIHIVPRWGGDTNFMPVTAGTKVVSSSMDAIYKLLAGGCSDA